MRHTTQLFCFLKPEILLCIVVANSLYNGLQHLLVIGIFALLYPGADQVTENPAEILMPGIGYKAPGIGQHSHEPAQQPQIGQSTHLLYHAVSLVVEPPAGAKLDLAGRRRLLEISQHGAKHIIVFGI